MERIQVAIAAMLVAVQAAGAQLGTTNSLAVFGPVAGRLDWSTLISPGGEVPNPFTIATLGINDLSVSITSPRLSLDTDQQYLPFYVSGSIPLVFPSTNSTLFAPPLSRGVTFEFSEPVTSFGAFIYGSGNERSFSASLYAYDANDVLIGSYAFAWFQPELIVDPAPFWGVSSEAGIKWLTLDVRQGSIPDGFMMSDGFVGGVVTTPEPSSLLLLSSGLTIGVGYYRRRRNARQSPLGSC
jgi:hypothetical protein